MLKFAKISRSVFHQKQYSIKFGIVGLPNVGKSTLYNAFGSGKALAANYPFATIEPNISLVNVPDERLEKLRELANSERIVPTTMKVVDIAGLVKGASKGDGLGNKFLANIREVDMITQVVRCFESDVIANVNANVDPCRDVEIIETELILKDLENLDKAITKLSKLAARELKAAQKLKFYQDLKAHLESGKVARSLKVTNVENIASCEELQLLTSKPIIYVANISENPKDNLDHVEKLQALVSERNSILLPICAELEAQIIELENPVERKEFMESIGMKETSLNALIKAAYKSLNLVTYFTLGPQEARAWTVHNGATAPQAGRVIHTDFETHFVKAEVTKFEDFVKYGSEAACKQHRKIRTEGKEYIVQDGDIMLFKKK
jgi:GTP-binding protein YchF